MYFQLFNFLFGGLYTGIENLIIYLLRLSQKKKKEKHFIPTQFVSVKLYVLSIIHDKFL